MTKLWKKIIHIAAVLFVAMAMVFSFLEPKRTVFAEGDENNGTPASTAVPGPVETPAATPLVTPSAQSEESPIPAPQPAATPSSEQTTQSYAITIDPIDTEDAYFDESTSNLDILVNKSAPFHVTVHQGPGTDSPAVEGAEVQVETNGLPVKYDSNAKTLTAENGETMDGDITLKYGDSERPVHIHIYTGSRYYINLSENELRMFPQTTSDQSVKVTVHDEFKDTTVDNADYEVSAGTGSVSFDKATGKVTSYDQYGEFDVSFTYKDATSILNVYVYAPVQEMKFNQDEINMKVGDDPIQLDHYASYLTFTPIESAYAPISVMSDHPDIVSAEEDEWNEYTWHIKPLQAGSAVVTVTSGDVSASVKVNVSAAGKADSIQFESKYDQNSEHSKDIYLKSGESADLKSYLFDANGNDVTEAAKDEVTYSLSRNGYYDSDFKLNGTKITATGNGRATVTASIGSGWYKTLTWTVHVIDKDPKNIRFDKEKYSVHLKDDNYYTQYVSLTSDGLNTEDFECTVKSDDESIVKVEETGSYNYILRPVRTGKTTIEAETYNGLKATAEVVVVDGDFATTIDSDTMDKTIPMKPGDTLKLEPVYTLSNGKTTKVKPKDEKVTYHIYDNYRPYVKLIDNKDGTAEIKALDFNNYVSVSAELTNGFTTSWQIQITPDITSLHFRRTECTVTDETEYNSLSQYLDVLPDQAKGSELAWSSSDIRTATVDNYGNVHIIKYGGDTTITASSKDGKVKDSILVHCRKAEAPQKIVSDKGDDINLYVGYATWFSLKGEPENSSRKFKIQVEDPDGVTDLNPENYNQEGVYSDSFYLSGRKTGNAKITATAIKNPSIKKVINIHVLDGKPSDKDVDLDYVIVPGGGFGSSDPDYDPSIDLFKENDDSHSSLHPEKYTFLKGGYYTIVTRYKNYVPVKGNVSVISGPLQFNGSDGFSCPSGYSIESYFFSANKAGSGILQISNGKKVEYEVVDTIVNKPVVDTGNASGELKEKIKEISNESIGMDKILQNAANSTDLMDNEKVQKAASELRGSQELKIEITNEIKYKSVEETKTGRKITVSITPKYVVKVINSNTGNQEKVVDEGELTVKEPVTLTIPVGKDLEEGRTLYVRHLLKNGTSRIYEGTVNDKGELVFDNPDGFSTFEITVDDPSTVKFGTVGYDSLEDALNNGTVQGTVHVLKGYKGKTDVTVNREISFTLDNQSDKTFNIKAGDGYALTRNGNDYYIAENYQKDNDPSKADWGKPVFVFTNNGTEATAVRTNKNMGSQTQKVTADVKLTETVAPTCTEKGKKVYTATAVFDGQTYTDQYTVETEDAPGHALQHVSAVPSTKDKTGNVEYWMCTRCGKYFSDAAGTHEIDPASVVLPPSKITGISWSQEPSDAEKTWTQGSAFRYAGKAVLTYENGETTVVNVTKDLFDLSGYKADQTGKQNVTLKLKADNSLTLNETVTVNTKKTGQKADGKSSSVNTGKKSDSVKKNNQKKNGSSVVDTSDHSNIGLYGSALACAVIALAAVLYIRRKHA